MKRALLPCLLLLGACDTGYDEASATKDRAAAQANWAIILKIDGTDVRLPLDEMNVLLFKDEEYASKNPTVFRIMGKEISLYGEIPPANQPGYGEDWKKMIGATLSVKAAGEYFHETIESKFTIPGKGEVQVVGGTLTPESYSGKWSGSQGDKTPTGKITLVLRDGRTVSGTFATHAFTWG